MAMKKINLIICVLFFIGIGIGKGQYIDLLNVPGVGYGARPDGNLIPLGNTFYGMASEDIGGHGIIFSLKKDGSNYKDLFDFGGLSGRDPAGSLTLSGDTLYGMTFESGLGGEGTLFSYNISTSSLDVMLNFNGSGSDIYGAYPEGDITLSVTGDTLYGTRY